MRQIVFLLVLGFMLIMASAVFATVCPDPNNSSLQWGEIPKPWEANPFSPHPVHGGAETVFLRANILQAGSGRGVLCTYDTPEGEYSIWWQVGVHLPSQVNPFWRTTLGGYECSQSRTDCEFFPGRAV